MYSGISFGGAFLIRTVGDSCFSRNDNINFLKGRPNGVLFLFVALQV